MQRDFVVNRRSMLGDVVNYALIFPAVFGLCFVHIQAKLFFSTQGEHFGTVICLGNIIIPMMVIAYKTTFDLVFDLENNRFIDYQQLLLSPRLLMVQRIMFSGFYTFCMSMLFFPILKLVLQYNFHTLHANWLQVIIIVLLGSLTTSAYHQLFATFIRSHQIGMFWNRINYIAMILGGAFMPTNAIFQFSPIFGNIIRINPFFYVTEGLRSSILYSNQFLSFTHCSIALTSMLIFFTAATCIAFKRRVDHL
jgi:ABC-type polysaccharide/polyol phosphate export permease